MTLKEIKRRVAEIDEERDDSERAHILEDKLFLDFIQHIADSKDDSYELKFQIKLKANEVLNTKSILFSRYCA